MKSTAKITAPGNQNHRKFFAVDFYRKIFAVEMSFSAGRFAGGFIDGFGVILL